MASPQFEVEDQLDEDFFDKLVNDDDDFDFTGSTRKHVVEAADSEEVKGFSNLTISETSPTGVESGGKDVDIGTEAKKGVEDAAISELLSANEDNVAAKEISSQLPSNVKECSVMETGEEGVLDGGTSKSDVASGIGVKEVQWSSLNSDLNVTNAGGSRTFSEIFNDFGDNSEDPFAEVGNKDDMLKEFNGNTLSVPGNSFSDLASSHPENNDVQYYGMGLEQNVDGQDFGNYQYWENLYPGWKYDPNTGQWYQVEGYMNTFMNSQESFGMTHSDNGDLFSDRKVDVPSLQKTIQSSVGTLAEDFGNSNTSNWNLFSQGNAEYPAHMVFDPQYPGWYYDTITLEWKMLEPYTSAVDQSAVMNDDQQYQNKNIESYEFQALGNQDLYMNQFESASNYQQQKSNSFQDHSVSKSGRDFSSETKQLGNIYSPAYHVDNHAEQKNEFDASRLVAPYKQQSQTFLHGSEISRFQSFIPAQSYTLFSNQTTVQPDQQMQFIPASIDAQKSGDHTQQPLQIGTPFSSSPNEGRSSAGRPPHALVTFGFGGKLVVMRNNSLFHTTAAYGNQVAQILFLLHLSWL